MSEPTTPGCPYPQALSRNNGIDLLRGISILLVVLHHIGLRIPLHKTSLGDYLPRSLLDALNYNGYEAVFIFFVISGFLITTNSLQRWGTLGSISLKGFYVRRFARIVPCLVLLILVLSLLDLLGVRNYTIVHANQSLAGAIGAAMGLYLNWYEGHTGYLPGGWDVLWSLSVEEVFYLGFPVVCLFLYRRRGLLPVLVLFALSLPVSHAALADREVWQEKAYLPGMSAIAMGILAALIAASPVRPRPAFVIALLATGVAGISAVFLIEGSLWSTLRDATLLLLTFSAACAVVACHWGAPAEPRPPPWGLGWLASLGRLSYEIYLTHMFVVFGAVSLFAACGRDLKTGYLWYIPALISSWLLGALVSRLMSQPADRRIRRWLLASAGQRRGVGDVAGDRPLL